MQFRPLWKVLATNTYIYTFHQLNQVDLTVTTEIFATIILQIYPSFNFLFFLSPESTKSEQLFLVLIVIISLIFQVNFTTSKNQLSYLHMFESWQQSPTIWTLPELLWRIFLCLFYQFANIVFDLNFSTQWFHRKNLEKMFHLAKTAQLSLTVAEWGRKWYIFDH